MSTAAPVSAVAALVAFVAARLDEDEHAARVAIAPGPTGRWEPHLGRNIGVVSTADSGQRVASVSRAAQVEHIARHDPARVLADVAAKRGLLAGLQPDLRAATGLLAPEDAGHALGVELRAVAVVRWLAASWASHPDYRPEWAVPAG